MTRVLQDILNEPLLPEARNHPMIDDRLRGKEALAKSRGLEVRGRGVYCSRQWSLLASGAVPASPGVGLGGPVCPALRVSRTLTSLSPPPYVCGLFLAV